MQHSTAHFDLEEVGRSFSCENVCAQNGLRSNLAHIRCASPTCLLLIRDLEGEADGSVADNSAFEWAAPPGLISILAFTEHFAVPTFIPGLE